MAESVERTERGLVIEGTRITLYEILDYLEAGWTPRLIAVRLNLAPQKIDAVMDWLNAHRQQVEQEYRQVDEDARSARAYWENRNKEKLTRLGKLTLEEIKGNLRAQKEKTA